MRMDGCFGLRQLVLRFRGNLAFEVALVRDELVLGSSEVVGIDFSREALCRPPTGVPW